jgi:hypothetical protein
MNFALENTYQAVEDGEILCNSSQDEYESNLNILREKVSYSYF